MISPALFRGLALSGESNSFVAEFTQSAAEGLLSNNSEEAQNGSAA